MGGSDPQDPPPPPGSATGWLQQIREIPDHATFREMEYTLYWLHKLGWFPSLALCNYANFDHLYPTKYIHYHFT